MKLCSFIIVGYSTWYTSVYICVSIYVIIFPGPLSLSVSNLDHISTLSHQQHPYGVHLPGGTNNNITGHLAAAAPLGRPLAKLKRFLGTLVQFGQDIGPDIGDRVRTLVLSLVVSPWTQLKFFEKKFKNYKNYENYKNDVLSFETIYLSPST